MFNSGAWALIWSAYSLWIKAMQCRTITTIPIKSYLQLFALVNHSNKL